MRHTQPTRPTMVLRRHRRHRGVAAMMAMMYLTLFAALAIGFYASVTTSVQVSSNDQRATMALASADSGMDFMRYNLANVSIPPGTSVSDSFAALYNILKNRFEGTANFSGLSVSMSGNTIAIPSDQSKYVKLESTGTRGFRVSITEWAGEIVVKVTGRYSTTYRTITMEYTRQNHPTQSFNYAVSSRGQVLVNGGTILSTNANTPTAATIMSAADGNASTPSITMSKGTVGGDLNILSTGAALITGGSVGGSSDLSDVKNNHLHVVSPPDFPTPDTSIYKPYATNTYNSSANTLTNVIIKAGTNPQIAGGTVIQGIMYVEAPNSVTFRGNVTLNGFIVVAQADNSGNAGTPMTTSIDFKGGVTQNPLPSGSQFDPMRATTGVSILAPTAAVSMGGSTASNLVGNVMVGAYLYSGAADITITNGTLMTFAAPGTTLPSNFNASASFTGSKSLKFTGTGAGNLPSPGLSYSVYFAPKANTYTEITP